MSAPDVLALARLDSCPADDVPGLAFEHNFEAASTPALAEKLAEAADFAIEGRQKMLEAGDYNLGISHFDKARRNVEAAHPLPEVTLGFANHAAQTLAFVALDRMTEGAKRNELPFGAEAIRPHLAAGKLAIDRIVRHQVFDSAAIDLGIAGAIAETYLPDATKLSGAWLHIARLESIRSNAATKAVENLAAAQARLSRTEQMYEHLDGRKQPPFRTMRIAASFTIDCLIEQPALPGQRIKQA